MEYKTMESMGIYKNERMGSMVFSSILLLIISRNHGKAWNLCKRIYTPLAPW